MSAIPKEVHDAVKAYLRKGVDAGFPEDDLDRMARLFLDVSDFFFNPDKVSTELMPVLVPTNATVVVIRQMPESIEVITATCEAHANNCRITALVEMIRNFASAKTMDKSKLN